MLPYLPYFDSSFCCYYPLIFAFIIRNGHSYTNLANLSTWQKISTFARTRQTHSYSSSRVLFYTYNICIKQCSLQLLNLPSVLASTCQTRRHSPSRVTQTPQTCWHLPNAIFEKNVTCLVKFARVICESRKFGSSGHSLVYCFCPRYPIPIFN